MGRVLYLGKFDDPDSIIWGRIFSDSGFQINELKSEGDLEEAVDGADALVFPVFRETDFNFYLENQEKFKNKIFVCYIKNLDPHLFEKASRLLCSPVDARLGPYGVLSVIEGINAFIAEKQLGIFSIDIFGEDSFLFSNPRQEKAYRDLAKVLVKKGPITIEGEDYCGCGVLVRLRHILRGRTGPFIEIDCKKCLDELNSNLLIGSGDKKGILDIAENGTVYFRNAHALTLDAQAAILGWFRVKKENNEKKENLADVVFFSDRNIQALALEGKFNRNLATIIGSIFLRLPPVRDRKNEIPKWCAMYCAGSKDVCSISPSALKALQAYSWPGNGKEIKEVLDVAIEKAGPSGTVKIFHLPKAFSRLGVEEEKENIYKLPRLAPKGPFPKLRTFRKRAQDQAEFAYLVKVLEESKGRLKEAMKISGLSKSTFYALLSKHGLLKLKEKFEKK